MKRTEQYTKLDGYSKGLETNQYYPFGTLYLNDKEYELQRYKYNVKEPDWLPWLGNFLQ